jgi:hypothetical protein
MPHFFRYWVWLSAGLTLSSCVDRYTPDVPAAAQANLVVDGFINPQGRTVIKLSRTFSVNTKSTAPVEARAQVAIQDDRGQRYTLVENPAGTYTSAALVLDPNQQYQLRLTTAQGREYASDKQPVVLTPAVDTLTWQLTSVEGIQLFLSTHGANTAARYYRWEYDETYQFVSAFESTVEYDARRRTVRTRGPSIYRCWRTEPSTAIVQGNSAQLSQNALVDFPLLTVLPSQKLRFGYSLLVRQYAQTQAEYNYWERLRKSTENLGTVNDPLPARVTGNVHALADTTEAVLGYVGVHSVTEKRLLVDVINQLPKPQPGSVFFDPAYASCLRTESFIFPLGLPQLQSGLLVPVGPIININTGDTIGTTASTPNCVDCRLRGTNVKPSYWP